MEFILLVLGVWILVAIFFLRERVKTLEQRTQKQDRDLVRLQEHLEKRMDRQERDLARHPVNLPEAPGALAEPEKRRTGEPEISGPSTVAELAARRAAERAAMGENARRMAAERYSPRAVADELEAVLREAIETA